MTDDKIIRKVEAIRRNNNRLWMNIVRVAIKYRPKETRKLLRQIVRNDRRVTTWMSRF
jgi:hypothetical protein